MYFYFKVAFRLEFKIYAEDILISFGIQGVFCIHEKNNQKARYFLD